MGIRDKPISAGSPWQNGFAERLIGTIRRECVDHLIVFGEPTKSPNPTDTHVGSRVRMRRLMLGMSQDHVASGLGVTFQQLQKYENGRNRISASRMQQIANILQVPPWFFFDGSPNQTKKDGGMRADISAFIATRDGVALIKAFTQLKSSKLKRAIVHLVEEVAAHDDE